MKYPQLPPNAEITEVSLEYFWSIPKVSVEYLWRILEEKYTKGSLFFQRGKAEPQQFDLG